MLGYKTNMTKFTRIDMIQSIVSDQNEMKLEISKRKKFGKLKNIGEIKYY